MLIFFLLYLLSTRYYFEYESYDFKFEILVFAFVQLQVRNHMCVWFAGKALARRAV